MNDDRRTVLKGTGGMAIMGLAVSAGLFKPGSAWAQAWNKAAFEAKTIDEARKAGMRVGGHVPAFMTAEQAVLAGYDEIQHMNMVFLNFLYFNIHATTTQI